MTKSNIKFRLVASGLEKLEGKYTATPLAVGTKSLRMLAAQVAKNRPAVDKHDVELIVNAIGAELADLINEGYTVSTELATFSPNISGSVPAMDSPLAEDNKFNVSVTEHSTLTTAVADLVPQPDKANSADITIGSVEDVATHTTGVIVGTNAFIVTGRGLSATQQGESLALIKDDGSVMSAASIVGESDDRGQWLRARLVTAVPAGAYKLRLITKGYGAILENPITITKKVTVK